jgi:anti-sigma28 factor (negative regulator of flagellin synthesis)
MKIEGNRPNLDASAAGKLEAARLAEAKAKEQGARTGRDAVTVSPDVELAQKAIDAASRPAEVRPDAVARGKALLEGGTLGSDPAALADTLIQRLIDQQD